MHSSRTIVTTTFFLVFLVDGFYPQKVSLSHVFSGTTYLNSSDLNWAEYKNFYNKTYRSDVGEKKRKNVWKSNLEDIHKHNTGVMKGLQSYLMGINRFTKLTANEFSRLMFSSDRSVPSATSVTRSGDSFNWISLPKSVDWRTKGIVTEVKNQGNCTSGWAFSAVGAIESQHAKVTGQLVSLSEQQPVDCSRRFNNSGCTGGTTQNALVYFLANMGVDYEKYYPYTGTESSCRAQRQWIGVEIKSYEQVHIGEDHLQRAVAEVGPVPGPSGLLMLQHYKNGVFVDGDCTASEFHAMLVVGYEPEYWIIKNSWGADWGIHGYIHWAKGRGNMCGVASDACYPIL